MSRRAYLGDSVYVDEVQGMIMLTTEDGTGPTMASNRIYLEPEVLAALLRWHLADVVAEGGTKRKAAGR